MEKETLCARCRKVNRVRTDSHMDTCVCGRELKRGGSHEESYRCESCARQEGVCKWCGGRPATTE
ncbi:hypothetical protein AMJ57_05050 [Parcubacteria bacterium SG8_24]|nr:MAG: hypothetical protein AMJ57_05050 [Parcubacteria bacterium SG8_24]